MGLCAHGTMRQAADKSMLERALDLAVVYKGVEDEAQRYRL